MAGKMILTAFRCFFLFYFCLFFITGSDQGYAAGDSTNAKKTILEVFDYLEEAHVSRPDADELMKGAIRGMIDTLKDPYTDYLSEEDFNQLIDDLEGSYGGIGVYLEGQADYPRVQEVFPGSPAMEAGLKTGDIIKKVDGMDIRGWPLVQAVEKIKGRVGTRVILVVGRGDSELTVELKRSHLNAPTVESKIIGHNTGYIDVKSFGSATPEQFKFHLDKLMAMRISGLVIDLRDNPGGYMDAAMEMAEIFLDPETPIVITKEYDGTVTRHLAGKDVKTVRVPLVVLINSQSASSSEILAGALKDSGGAALVGEKTYGKGTGQSLVRLRAGGTLKITTTEYTTPLGTRVDGQGIKPDFEVVTRELQVPFALRILEPQPKQIVFKGSTKEVLIDGDKIPARNTPAVKNGAMYLPLRFTLEALGYVVSWEEKSGVITARKKDAEIVLPAAGNPLFNGRELSAGSGVFIEDGVSYISLDLIKKLGYAAEQDGDLITVRG
ncbi:MAG: PDZ domain-containing protein [Peptococcaceae bacterium]|nr:PDZ domain-containing protein [Peptococcaceae bacterium]